MVSFRFFASTLLILCRLSAPSPAVQRKQFISAGTAAAQVLAVQVAPMNLMRASPEYAGIARVFLENKLNVNLANQILELDPNPNINKIIRRG